MVWCFFTQTCSLLILNILKSISSKYIYLCFSAPSRTGTLVSVRHRKQTCTSAALFWYGHHPKIHEMVSDRSTLLVTFQCVSVFGCTHCRIFQIGANKCKHRWVRQSIFVDLQVPHRKRKTSLPLIERNYKQLNSHYFTNTFCW